MKSKLIAAVMVLSVGLLFTGVTPAYGGKHGGNAGFSSSVGGHGGKGGYSGGYGGGYGGGLKGYGGNGSMRGYTGGGLGKIHGSSYGSKAYSSKNYGYSPKSYSSQKWNGTKNYGSRSNFNQSGKNYSSLKSSGKQHLNRGQTGLNGSDKIASANQSRRLNTNKALTKQQTGLYEHSITTKDGKNHQGKWARNNPHNKNRFDQKTENKLRDWKGHKSDWAEAKHNHDEHHHKHHDHDWWHDHCDSIIIVGGGWWGWYDGWWYPAWGYDPYYSYYAYDGPIYGYDGLPPDEVVANVQNELQRLGYYTYAVDGIMGPLTQEALMRYQRDRGIPITGGIDATTVGSLGLS